MAGSIMTLGEILVEFIAETCGQGFREPSRFAGPFPSGAPAIFIDQVARLGHPAGMIGCVGDDDFGVLNRERLRADGVDTSGIDTDRARPTGSAFVRYREDGGRDFIFNIAYSAAGQTRLTDAARALLAGCGHFHVMGSSLFSPDLFAVMQTAMGMVKEQGGTVSFDPNLRGAMLDDPAIRAALDSLLRQCDIFLPSGTELRRLAGAATDEAAVAEILGRGVSCIVRKQGADGAAYHDRSGMIALPGHSVEEIDPTGAGDCFGATFITCRRLGHTVRDSLAYANAAGAIAVGVQGPMEGNSCFATLNSFLEARR
jgi:sugar/nucleoside kinase (ribokinase family)